MLWKRDFECLWFEPPCTVSWKDQIVDPISDFARQVEEGDRGLRLSVHFGWMSALHSDVFALIAAPSVEH